MCRASAPACDAGTLVPRLKAPAARPDTLTMEDRRDIGGHGSVAAGAIAAYWLVDGYVIGPSVSVLAAFWNPLMVFACSATLVALINLAACRWINTAWSSWTGGSNGARIERQLDRVRPTRAGRAATRWVSSDSNARFAAAAALTCAIVAVTIGRSVGGRPLNAHRIGLASVSYALFFVGLFTLVGVAAGETLGAL
jgi:hypothetical protein